MPPPPPDEILSALLVGVILLLLVVQLGAWAWAVSRLARGTPLLAEQPALPLLPARFGGGTVSVMILVYLGINLFVGQTLGPALGLKPPAPPQHKEAGPAAAEDGDPQEEHPDESDESREDALPSGSYLSLMLLQSIASGLFVLTLPALLRRTADVGIAELGFSWVGWPGQVGTGVVAALLATPAVYAIHILAAVVWEANQHPVERMMADQMSLEVAVLAFVSTVVLAPLVEESMFRGVLLGWLTRVFSPPALEARTSTAATEDLGAVKEDEARPVDVVLPANVPARNVVCWPAVVLTSLLFAGLHVPQWPAPIGIFFLSMVLGVVYQRTGSLLTAMVLHGVFNGSSTILFLVGSLARTLQAPRPGPAPLPLPQPAARAMMDVLGSFLLF